MKPIVFKTPELEAQFYKTDLRLQVLVYALGGFILQEFGKQLVITSVFRDDDVTSLHFFYCAVDFRVETSEGVVVFSPEEIKRIKVFCSRFIYDENRPSKRSLLIHENRLAKGKHGHLQVFPSSDKTKVKNNGN